MIINTRQNKNNEARNLDAPTSARAEPLDEAHRLDALKFLSRRPVNTVILAGWIQDHGIVSSQHRGTFYGCRDVNGELIGVAMIGRNVLFETSTDAAIEAFAWRARTCTDIRMIFAEDDKLLKFWQHYKGKAPMPRLSRHHLITSRGSESKDAESVMELRIATLDDLAPIVTAHAEMVLEETGTDPLVTDADGFRKRCAQRIEQRRIWVWMSGRDLIFKIDIVSDTSGVIYTEGLWVRPEERGKGYGTKCFRSVSERLANGKNVVCGFVDEARIKATDLYSRSGFFAADRYSRIYI